MSARVAPVLAPVVVALALAGCTGAARIAPPAPSAPSFVTSWFPRSSSAPAPLPASQPDTGDVAGASTGPELSIEPFGTDTIAATVTDPAAKAWRFVVAGTGDRSGDQWVLQVETGDVGPVVTSIETVGGLTREPVDRTSLVDGSPAARVCSVVLPVCVEAIGLRLPQDGDGTLLARLVVTDPAVPLAVTGATATWAGEPFVLGPWTSTAAFPWGS